MAKQHLHRPQVGAVIEQVGGEGMAQRVRRQRRGNARRQRLLLHDHPEHHPAHPMAARGDEQVLGLLAAEDGPAGFGKVAHQPVARQLAERHQPLLAALAQHPQHALVHPEVEGLQTDQFADAQAAGVHQLQHGAVAQPQRLRHVGRRQQRLHLRLAQRLWNAQRLPGRLQLQGRVGADDPLAQGPPEVALEHRQPPVGRGRAGLAVAGGEIGVEVGFGSRGYRLALRRQPAAVQAQVAPIRRERVLRQPFLQPDGVDERVDFRE